MALSVSTFAGNPTEPAPVTKSQVALYQVENMVKLICQPDEITSITVKIYDENGQRLITRQYRKTEGFLQPFNMEELDYGRYTFEITDENGTLVEIVDYKPVVVKSVAASMYKVKDYEKVRLSVVLNEDNPAEISIFDANNNLVHSEKATESFSRVYDVANIENGFYISVSDKNGIKYLSLQK